MPSTVITACSLSVPSTSADCGGTGIGFQLIPQSSPDQRASAPNAAGEASKREEPAKPIKTTTLQRHLHASDPSHRPTPTTDDATTWVAGARGAKGGGGRKVTAGRGALAGEPSITARQYPPADRGDDSPPPIAVPTVRAPPQENLTPRGTVERVDGRWRAGVQRSPSPEHGAHGRRTGRDITHWRRSSPDALGCQA